MRLARSSPRQWNSSERRAGISMATAAGEIVRPSPPRGQPQRHRRISHGREQEKPVGQQVVHVTGRCRSTALRILNP